MKTVRLLSVGSMSNVAIDGLEIEFGATAGLGGGIDNSGRLTVTNSTFLSNSAGNGGGIADEAGATLTFQNSTFSNNTTTGVGGGAIIASAAITLERSAIIDNTAHGRGLDDDGQHRQ